MGYKITKCSDGHIRQESESDLKAITITFGKDDYILLSTPKYSLDKKIHVEEMVYLFGKYRSLDSQWYKTKTKDMLTLRQILDSLDMI